MSVAILLVAIVPALLVAAAFFDLTTYTIPNLLPGAMALLFVVFMFTLALAGHAMSWSHIGLHLLAGFIGLLLGMGMFAVGWVGGGDAKLFAAVLLWLGWDALYDYVILALLIGGLLTVALIVLRHMPLPSALAKLPWLVRLAEPKGGVPYGVALALAALHVLPNTEVFRLAAIS
jgi:prepilin peptidase CpaA